MGILHENSDVSLKTESFHDANFIVTGTTCLTTSVATIGDKVGIMTISLFSVSLIVAIVCDIAPILDL